MINIGGISFTGLLTVIFIVLKLVGKITWSWWWVVSPTLIGVGVIVGFLLTMDLTMYIIKLVIK